MNEAEIKRHINLIYDEEATIGSPLREAMGKILLSQMRLYTAMDRHDNRAKAESLGQIEAAAVALHNAKQLIEGIATQISTLEVSMQILEGLAKGQL